MPLINEDRPKCYMCSLDFSDIKELRDHQKKKHNEAHNSNKEHSPAPGDVTVF